MAASFSSLNLVLLGPPGAGKSTQAGRLAARYEIPHLGTADELRPATEAGEIGDGDGAAEAGRAADGRLLQRLHRDDCARGFLLDGYPTTLEQANRLDATLAELGRGLARVIEIAVPDDTAEERLATPVAGDAGNGAGERLRAYHETTDRVLDLYRQRGVLLKIDGTGSPDRVTDSLLDALGAPVGA